MKTYRERRLARANRLREWADKRQQKAESCRNDAQAYIDMVPFGQPILVGHHSEKRARRDQSKFVSNVDKSIEHGDKAEQMQARAENIELAAASAIYNDDPDAIPRLEKKIALLENERQTIKAYNASCRKGSPDENLLSDDQRKNLQMLVNIRALGDKGQMPAYVTVNLGGNINRLKKRLHILCKP